MSTFQLPRRLVLVRHAKSSWESDAARDVDRPLAPRGEAATPGVASYLDERNLVPEWVLCSPAVRTRRTWALIRAALDVPPTEVFDPALYLGSARTLLTRIGEVPPRVSTVMLIGHNPGLQDLAAELATRADPGVGEAVAAKFPTAAVLALEYDCASWAAIDGAPARLLGWRTPKGREPGEF